MIQDRRTLGIAGVMKERLDSDGDNALLRPRHNVGCGVADALAHPGGIARALAGNAEPMFVGTQNDVRFLEGDVQASGDEAVAQLKLEKEVLRLIVLTCQAIESFAKFRRKFVGAGNLSRVS